MKRGFTLIELMCVILVIGVLASFLIYIVQVYTGDDGSKMDDIRYMKDPETGLCFAYIERNPYTSHGNLALTEIPCEKIENRL